MQFINKIAQYTGEKAVENGAEIVVIGSQILRFMALSTRMNLYKLPSLKHYFANEIGDFGARKFMDKQVFFKIRAIWKCVRDVDVSMISKQKDPLWKFRPVLDSIKHAMAEVPRNPENLCIDEQIVPFTGGMPNKVVIKSKPHPVGLKLYCLADPSGTILSFIPYTGAKTFEGELASKPQGEAAVASLCESVDKGCTIYLDRFFTGLGVLKCLQEQSLKVTGTVQRNRLPKSLRDKILPESADRGSSHLLVNRSEDIALTCWKDSRVVLLLSSGHAIYPETSCKRGTKGQKTKKTFRQPDSVAKYNANMGGVNLMDRMLALYPHFAYRTFKWTVRVILHCFMLAAINIWYERGKPMRLFDHTILLTDEILVHAKKTRNAIRNHQWRYSKNSTSTSSIPTRF